MVRERIAQSRLEVDQARLLVLQAAWRLDHEVADAAAGDLAAIKVVCPRMACEVIDRAIHLHGGAGMSDDTPLAFAYAYARTIKVAFGPEDADVSAVAERELAGHP